MGGSGRAFSSRGEMVARFSGAEPGRGCTSRRNATRAILGMKSSRRGSTIPSSVSMRSVIRSSLSHRRQRQSRSRTFSSTQSGNHKRSGFRLTRTVCLVRFEPSDGNGIEAARESNSNGGIDVSKPNSLFPVFPVCSQSCSQFKGPWLLPVPSVPSLFLYMRVRAREEYTLLGKYRNLPGTVGTLGTRPHPSSNSFERGSCGLIGLHFFSSCRVLKGIQ